MERGKYIVFEGPEGSGKSTHSHMFAPWLEEYGLDIGQIREPGGTPGAEALRSNLKTLELGSFEQLLLMQACRRNLFDNLIIPKLEQGSWVVSDRDKVSSWVYQGFAGGEDMDLVGDLNKRATRGINPDFYFILDVPVEIGFENEIETDQLGGDLDFRHKVRKGYLEYAKRNPKNTLVVEYEAGEKGIERMQNRIKDVAYDRFLKN